MLDEARTDLTFSSGRVGARQNALRHFKNRLDDEGVQLEADLSENPPTWISPRSSRDLRGPQAALQAALQTMAQTTQLTAAGLPVTVGGIGD